MRKPILWIKQFNWRMLLVRILINAIALVLVTLITPRVYFVDKSLAVLLIVSVALGIINAIVKPIVQFLTFQMIFASYGIVIILINSLILWFLSLLFPDWYAVDSIIWAFVGGALLGIISSFLEALFGVSIPIVPQEDVELRALISKEKPGPLETILTTSEAKLQDQAAGKEETVAEDEAAAGELPGDHVKRVDGPLVVPDADAPGNGSDGEVPASPDSAPESEQLPDITETTPAAHTDEPSATSHLTPEDK